MKSPCLGRGGKVPILGRREGSLDLGREVSVFRSGKVSAFGSRVGKSPCLSRVGGGKSGSGEGSLRV